MLAAAAKLVEYVHPPIESFKFVVSEVILGLWTVKTNKNFQVSVGLLQLVKLLDAPIGIGANVVPCYN